MRVRADTTLPLPAAEEERGRNTRVRGGGEDEKQERVTKKENGTGADLLVLERGRDSELGREGVGARCTDSERQR